MISFDDFLKQEEADKYNMLQEAMYEAINKNDIIRKLEEWLETQRYFEYEDPFTGEYAKDEITPIVQTLDKIRELKGEDIK